MFQSLFNTRNFLVYYTYCKVRWLSLNKCVNRIRTLLAELTQFFLTESEDTTNTRAVRDIAGDLYIQSNDITFRLYIEFLCDTIKQKATDT